MELGGGSILGGGYLVVECVGVCCSLNYVYLRTLDNSELFITYGNYPLMLRVGVEREHEAPANTSKRIYLAQAGYWHRSCPDRAGKYRYDPQLGHPQTFTKTTANNSRGTYE